VPPWSISSVASQGSDPIEVVVGSIEMSPNAAHPTEACVMLKPVACRLPWS
jgi:hypothetical protein